MEIDTRVGFIFGLFCFFFGSLLGYSFATHQQKTDVYECEKDLPRSVHCKLIAVPVDKN